MSATPAQSPSSTPVLGEDAAAGQVMPGQSPAGAVEQVGGAGGISQPSFSSVAARELIDEAWLDELMARVSTGELALTGPGGFLPELLKTGLESGLQAELTDHMGYEKGDPACVGLSSCLCKGLASVYVGMRSA
jgi:hypothetical protein